MNNAVEPLTDLCRTGNKTILIFLCATENFKLGHYLLRFVDEGNELRNNLTWRFLH